MIMSVDESASSAASLEEFPIDRSTPVPSIDSAAASATSAAKAQPSMGDQQQDNAVITKPKRPLSAYNMFFRDQRELLLESLPSRHGKKPKRSHGKINFNDLAKTIAAKWKDIDPEEKAKYEAVAAVGREKYVKLAKEWKKQQRKLAKQKKRADSTAPSTAKVATGPVTLPIKSPITHPYATNEAPATASATDIMMGRVASSRILSHRLDVGSRGYDMDSSHNSTQSRYPTEISMGSTAYGSTAASPYEPIPAFEDMEPNDTSTASYDSRRQVWNEMPPREPFMFDNNYNRQQEAMMMTMTMHTTSGSPLRAGPPRNSYAFDNQQQQPQNPALQRLDLPTIRSSASLPQIAASMDAMTWSHLNAMDPPRRLHSLPSGTLNTSFEMQRVDGSNNPALRMLQPALPFAPSNIHAQGSMMHDDNNNNALNPVFETSMSSTVGYYQSDEMSQQQQPQQQRMSHASNFQGLQQAELFAFDYPPTDATGQPQQQQQQAGQYMHRPYNGSMYGNNNLNNGPR